MLQDGERDLPQLEVYQLHVRGDLVPVGGDVLQRHAYVFGVARQDRGAAHVNQVRISAHLVFDQHVQRHCLFLYDLVQSVVEDQVHVGGFERLIAGIGDGGVEIGHRAADVVLRCADLGVGDLELRDVGI